VEVSKIPLPSLPFSHFRASTPGVQAAIASPPAEIVEAADGSVQAWIDPIRNIFRTSTRSVQYLRSLVTCLLRQQITGRKLSTYATVMVMLPPFPRLLTTILVCQIRAISPFGN
jgi:hypothetical protein